MRKTLELNQKIAPEHFFFFPYIPLRGTPLYNKAKEEGLLLTSKKNLHYLSAVNDQKFTQNMKECPELLTAEEYDTICRQMLDFQQKNNRLSYMDEAATVEDKSFNLVEDEVSEQSARLSAGGIEAQQEISQKPAISLFDGVKNLFRS